MFLIVIAIFQFNVTITNMVTLECYLLKQFHQLSLPSNCFDQLPVEQRSRASKLNGKRLQEFYFGRQLLKFACDQLDTKNITPPYKIIERENNAPQLKDSSGRDLASSISHSSKWLGVVICHDPNVLHVGIDIETIRDDWSIEKANFFCNQQQISEALAIQDTALRNRFFTTIWAQKEAHFKAGGQHVLNTNSPPINPALLQTKNVDNTSIMSIYCAQQTMINIQEVSINGSSFTEK